VSSTQRMHTGVHDNSHLPLESCFLLSRHTNLTTHGSRQLMNTPSAATVKSPESSAASALPDALDPSFLRSLSSRACCFFLDYDGTLAPIVNEPDRAFISEETRQVVSALAAAHPVGLVSGRSNDKLRAFLQIGGLFFAGSHGVDIVGPAGEEIDGPDPVTLVGPGALEALKRARAALDAALGDIPGYLTEDNVYCISAHYRMVDPAQHERVRETTLALLQELPLLHHKEGKMVHELRPAVDWHKGKAVEWLLQLLRRSSASADSLYPIYLGDDVADEDAFRAVQALGGVGIKVARGSVLSDATAATRSLEQPQVVHFLKALVDSREGASVVQQDSESAIGPR